MARSDYRKGAIPYAFVAVPKLILASAEWQSLPHSARALALDLSTQYTSKNNGRLCPAFDVMRRSGWTSKDTLARAKKALLEVAFVVQTRKGHPPRTAEWVGFTWWKLDYHESMDIDPRHFPYLNFVTGEATTRDPNEGREKTSVPRKPYPYLRKAALRPPESVPTGITR